MSTGRRHRLDRAQRGGKVRQQRCVDGDVAIEEELHERDGNTFAENATTCFLKVEGMNSGGMRTAGGTAIF